MLKDIAIIIGILILCLKSTSINVSAIYVINNQKILIHILYNNKKLIIYY